MEIILGNIVLGKYFVIPVVKEIKRLPQACKNIRSIPFLDQKLFKSYSTKVIQQNLFNKTSCTNCRGPPSICIIQLWDVQGVPKRLRVSRLNLDMSQIQVVSFFTKNFKVLTKKRQIYQRKRVFAMSTLFMRSQLQF